MKHRPKKTTEPARNSFSEQTNLTTVAVERREIYLRMITTPCGITIPEAVDAYVATGMTRPQAINVVARQCAEQMKLRRIRPSLFKEEPPVDLVHVPMGWTHEK